MADFSYSVRTTVDKELAVASDPLLSLDLCTLSQNQSAPKLQLSFSSFGTAAAEGVYSACADIGSATSSSTTLVSSTQFGTNADNSYVFLRESSTNTASVLGIRFIAAGPTIVNAAELRNGEAAFFRLRPDVSVAAAASAVGVTGTIQVLAIGE